MNTPLEVSLSHKAAHMRGEARRLAELAKQAHAEGSYELADELLTGAAACKTVEFSIRRWLKAVKAGREAVSV